MPLATNQNSSVKYNYPDQIAQSMEVSEIGEIRPLKYLISARGVLRWLMLLTLLLNFIGALGRGIEYLLGITETTPLVRLFHVAEEGNVTTWFSAMLLLCSSVLLAVIASAVRRQGKPYFWHWTILSVLFFYMNLDEAARLHELTITPLRSLLNASGIFYYSWVILAIPMVIAVGIFYAKFLRNLPRYIALLFILAGGVYVFGAVGMDMAVGFVITGQHWILNLEPILVTIEELLENVGIVLFIYALLVYIRYHLQVSEFQFLFSR